MFQNTNFISIKKLLESSAMDKYYEKKFGITRDYNTEDVNSYNIVAKVGKYQVAIVKNPKSLEGFDSDVRAISDEKGDLYVAYKRQYFNHGDMANALIKAGLIDTLVYNQDAIKEPDLQGVYEDQNHFLLFNRLEDEDVFVPSDTFEWEGAETEKLLKAVKEKHPQFKFDLKYFENKYAYDSGDDDLEIDENFKYPSLFESPDEIIVDKKVYHSETSNAYAFEVILNIENDKIIDVLISSAKQKYHGEDPFTNGPLYGSPNTWPSHDSEKIKPYGVHWKKIYPGRLFLDAKVITFWIYPSNKELKQIVEIIEKKKNIQIYDNDWKIEIYSEGMAYKGRKDYHNNYERDRSSKIIPIEKYIGSKKPPEKAYLQHLDTKTKHKVPYGYGSKNPAYMGKRQWQMASLTDEGIKKPFYPKLLE